MSHPHDDEFDLTRPLIEGVHAAEIDQPRIAAAVREILEAMGEDPERDGLLDTPARDIPNATLDAILGPGYGIFAGDRLQWATLRFSPERSRWVSTEFWHPAQKGHLAADGHYVLEVPYADHRELLMDILHYGADAEIVGQLVERRILGQVLQNH